jgi:hypothetical protein
MTWVPISQFAREYNKSRNTIVNWITTGFIFSLGVSVKKDVTGHWFIGKPSPNSLSSTNSMNTF